MDYLKVYRIQLIHLLQQNGINGMDEKENFLHLLVVQSYMISSERAYLKAFVFHLHWKFMNDYLYGFFYSSCLLFDTFPYCFDSFAYHHVKYFIIYKELWNVSRLWISWMKKFKRVHKLWYIDMPNSEWHA